MNALSNPDFFEPVAACATPPGFGGIAIVRLSGRDAQALAKHLLPASAELPETQRAFFHAPLHHPSTGALLDEAVILSFPGRHSYTGEPVVEFQVHGGQLSVRRVLEALSSMGVRLALPGEFTRRAFLHGRLDLTEAEAIMDLIGAEAERSANVALAQLQGGLRERIEPLYEDLLHLRADVEASLDFEDSEVPNVLSTPMLLPRAEHILHSVQQLLATWHEGKLLREGAHVVIAGRPNAGKSSLFNALLATDRAIVSDEPGTTRDLLEEMLSLDGIPLRLIDTAGLRDATGTVERLGVSRAKEVLQRADLHLIVIDASHPDEGFDMIPQSRPSIPTVVVFNKLDLVPSFVPPSLPKDVRGICVSALTGEGISSLRAALRDCLGLASPALSGHTDIAVNERHRELLDQAAASLREAREGLLYEDAFDPVLVAQSLRAAAESLGSITGHDASDDLLDAIFSRFCIGK